MSSPGPPMTRTSRHIAAEAERRLPVRVRVAVPPGGFGNRLAAMHAWLDDNCGLDGWAEAPAGLRGVVNDAVAFYFRDPGFAVAFVTRWCSGAGEAILGGASLRCPTATIPTGCATGRAISLSSWRTAPGMARTLGEK
jgi:hypothetical protein